MPGEFYIEGKREKLDLSSILEMLQQIKDMFTVPTSSIDLWSGFDVIEIDTTESTKALPSITIAGVPEESTLIRAVAVIKFRTLSEWADHDAALREAQQIQARKAIDGFWVTGIELLNNQLRCPASAREFGDVLIGTQDIAGQVPPNGEVIEFQWLNARVWDGELHLEDLQMGVRIWFTA